MCVVGASQSGKSSFVARLILNRDKLIVGSPIKKIIWCCRSKSFVPTQLNNIKDIVIVEGLPNLKKILPNSLIIIDDLMIEAFNRSVCELFTVDSHHRSVSVILLLHNLFYQSKFAREVSLNNQYIIFFRNLRDQTQFSIFARQICPDNWRSLTKVYKEATSLPYSYFLIDLTQEANEIFRYKSNIFNPIFFECYTTIEDAKKHSEDQQIFSIEKKPAFFARAFRC